MINKEQAIQSIFDVISDDVGIDYESIIEKEYGWVIFTNSKKYLETRDISFMLVGSGGTLVERNTGKHIEFGSAYPLAQNLQKYEKGYLKYDNWDLIITKIFDLKECIDHLGKLNIQYVITEEAYGTVWRVPKNYKPKQLKQKIKNIPARFNIGNLYFLTDEIETFEASLSCSFELVENIGYENSN